MGPGLPSRPVVYVSICFEIEHLITPSSICIYLFLAGCYVILLSPGFWKDLGKQGDIKTLTAHMGPWPTAKWLSPEGLKSESYEHKFNIAVLFSFSFCPVFSLYCSNCALTLLVRTRSLSPHIVAACVIYVFSEKNTFIIAHAEQHLLCQLCQQIQHMCKLSPHLFHPLPHQVLVQADRKPILLIGAGFE